jgi:hypothetical protein
MTAAAQSPAARCSTHQALDVHELLNLLIEATPVPTMDFDVEELLVVFEDIMARRAELISQITAPLTLSEIDRPLLAELERRQNLWQDVLATALRTVGERRCGASHLRAYAGAP